MKLDTDKYAAKVEDLLAAFQARFTEMASEQSSIDLLTNPFTFPESNISSLPDTLQFEIIDLKCNSALRSYFFFAATDSDSGRHNSILAFGASGPIQTTLSICSTLSMSLWQYLSL